MRLLCIWIIQVTTYAFVLSLTACQFNPLIMSPDIHLWENAKETLKGSVGFYRTELTALKHGPSLKDANNGKCECNLYSKTQIPSHSPRCRSGRSTSGSPLKCGICGSSLHLLYKLGSVVTGTVPKEQMKRTGAASMDFTETSIDRASCCCFDIYLFFFQSAKNVLSNSTFLVILYWCGD